MRRRVNGEAISETDWGLFPKLEGGKNQVGSEAEVGNEYKRRERSKWKGPFAGHFSGLKCRLLILLGCLVCFFSAFCGRGKK